MQRIVRLQLLYSQRGYDAFSFEKFNFFFLLHPPFYFGLTTAYGYVRYKHLAVYKKKKERKERPQINVVARK